MAPVVAAVVVAVVGVVARAEPRVPRPPPKHPATRPERLSPARSHRERSRAEPGVPAVADEEVPTPPLPRGPLTRSCSFNPLLDPPPRPPHHDEAERAVIP